MGQIASSRTTHSCQANGCDHVVPLQILMCGKHWRMVPRPLQDDVWATYRRGQELDLNLSDDYVAAADAAIRAVARKQTPAT